MTLMKVGFKAGLLDSYRCRLIHGATLDVPVVKRYPFRAPEGLDKVLKDGALAICF